LGALGVHAMTSAGAVTIAAPAATGAGYIGGTASIDVGGNSVAVDMTSVTDNVSLTSAFNAAGNGLGITATLDTATSVISFTGNIAGSSATDIMTISGTDSAAGAIANVVSTVAATADIHTDDINISTVAGTSDALQVIDAALLEISDSRANLGAVQNRFGHTINNLSNIQENVSASRSRIEDTDFASETAQMTKNQILQQAGTSILAQSNQLPQAALSLL
jgi:flagellin